MLYSIAAVLVLVLDQAVKYWTVRNIPPQAINDACVQLIPGVLHMTNVQNNGAAFSILADQRWLLVGVSALFIIGIIVLISMDIIHTKFGRWTAVLVMAGALGNCIDRVLLGYVVDMFEFELFNFAVFNVADIFITVCGILFCIHVIVYHEPEAVRNAVPRPEKGRGRGRKAPEPEYDDYDDYDEEAPRRKAPKAAKASKGKKGRAGREKEDPYANIPRRGEHRSLADDLELPDPDDPFSEWGEDIPAAAPARRSQPAAPARTAAPAQRPARRQAQNDWDDYEPAVPAKRPSAPARQRPAAPAPKPAQSAPKRSGGSADDYSLEDILAEFRDL